MKTDKQLDREIALVVGPGPRPSDPREISFARDCFVQDGTRTEYVVPAAPGSTAYPRAFDDRADAEAWARKTRQPVRERAVPIMRRIKWR
jgi:hypothetical protein